MKLSTQVFFSTVLALSVFLVQNLIGQCPTISIISTDPDCTSACEFCIDDIITFDLIGAFLGDVDQIDWYISEDEIFDPFSGEGTFIGSSGVSGVDYDPCNVHPTIQLIFVHGCNPAAPNDPNEFFIIHSGSGFELNNLQVFFPNNTGMGNNDIVVPQVLPCSWDTPDQDLIDDLIDVAPSCNTGNFIPVSPGEEIPPEALVIVLTDRNADFAYNFDFLCGNHSPVYVIQNGCFRTSGAFRNLNQNPGSDRILTIEVFGCSDGDDFVYNTDVSNSNGGQGDYAYLDADGNVAYANDGCANSQFENVPFPVSTVSLDQFSYIFDGEFCGNYYIAGVPNPEPSACGLVITESIEVFIDCADPTFEFPNFCVGGSNGPINIETPGGTFNFLSLPGDGASIDPVTGEISNATVGTTYFVQYTTSGDCSESLVVEVAASGLNLSGDDLLFELCEVDDPFTLELSDYDDEVSEGNPYTVTWFSDIELMDLISSIELSDTETVFAVVSDGDCESDPIEVTFELSLLPGFQNVETNVVNCGPYTLPDIEAENPGVPNIGYYFNPGGNNLIVLDEIGISIPIYLYGGEGDCFEEIQINITINTLPVLNPIDDVISCGPYTLPPLTGSNVTPGNSSYFNEEGMQGTEYNIGQQISESGTYYAVSGNPGCFDEIEFEITILQPEEPEFDLVAEYCMDDTAQSLPNVSDNDIPGSWSPANINTSAAGTTTYTFTPNPDECANPFELQVIVHPAPAAIAENDGPYCEEDEINLNSSGGTSYSWEGPDGFIADEQNPIISNANSSMAGTYTVTVTDANGCTAEESTVVAINEDPDDPVLEVDCSMGLGNGVITVSSPVGPDLEYSLNGGAPQTSPEFTGLDNGTYTVVVINGNTGCESEEVSIEVDCGCADEPEVNLSEISGEVCGTESIIVVNNTFGGSATEVTLTHNGNGTLDPSGSGSSPFDFTYTPAAADMGTVVTITIETNNPLGAPCEAAIAAFELTVIEVLTPVFSIATEYCEGETADALPLISDNLIEGSWSPAEIDTDIIGSEDYVFTPDAGECAEEVTVSVTIEESLIPGFSFATEYCEGETADALPLVSDNGIEGSWSPAEIDTDVPGVVDYLFTPDAGQCADEVTVTVAVEESLTPVFSFETEYCQGATADALPLVSDNEIEGSWSPAEIDTEEAGTSMYTFTPDGENCAEVVEVEIIINPSPSATASNDGPVCEDGDLQLSATGDGDFNWEGPFGFNSTEQNPLLEGVGTTQDGTYTVTVTDSNGCSTTAQTEVAVNELPPATASNDGPFCAGEEVLLMSSGGTEYEWSGPNGYSSMDQNPGIPNASPDIAGEYIVTVTDANGCSATAITEVEVLELPEVEVSSNSPVCPGEEINLSGAGGEDYNWTGPDGFTSTEQNPVISNATGANAGTYQLTVADANGCTSAASVAVSVADPISFQILSSECAADLQSYTVLISTDGDEVETSDGAISDLGNGQFEISEVDIDNDLVITITNSTTGCSEEFTVAAPDCDCPSIAAPMSGGNQEICEGDPIPELTATTDPDFQINWYDASTGGNLLLENSNSFTPPGPGTYFAEAFDPISECVSVQRTPVILTVHPNPEIEFISAECAADLLTYTLIIETNANLVVSSLGNVANVGGQTFEISDISAGEPVSITVEISSTGCTEEWEFDGEECECPEYDPPVSGGDLIFCEGDVPGEISVSAPAGLQVNWYDQAVGGDLLLENSETFLPTAAGVYFAETVDPVNGCTSAERTPVAVIEDSEAEFNQLLVECEAGFLTYLVQFSTDAENIEASEGVLTDLGGGVYEVSDIDLNNNLILTLWNELEDCAATFEVEAPDCDCPFIPAPQSAGDVSICEGEPFPELIAEAGPGLQVNWYEQPQGGDPVLENSTNFLPPAAGTWYAGAYDPDSDCSSEDRTAVTLTVNPNPDYILISSECDPGNDFYTVIIETEAEQVLSGQGTVVPLAGNQYEVIDIPVGENLDINLANLSTGCSMDDVILAPDCDCPELDPPTAVSDLSFELCVGDVIPFLEVATNPGLLANWYDAPDGTDPLESGSLSFQPNISNPGTYTFYAETIDPENDCVSEARIEFTIVIHALPTFTIALVACDADGESYFVQLTTQSGNLVFANVGNAVEGNPGEWEISGIDLSEEVEIDFVNPLTDCVSSVSISAPDCDCPQFVSPGSLTACGFFVLPDINGNNLTGNEAYYDQAGGQGQSFQPGDTLFEGGIIYIYDQFGDCEVESSFELELITFDLVHQDGLEILECSPEPDFTFFVNDYNDLVSEGSGGAVSWFADSDLIFPIQTNVSTSGATIYAVVTVDVCDSDPIPVMLTVATAPGLENPGNLEDCEEVELPDIASANSFPNEGYYSGENGTGDFFQAGTILTESTILYLFSGDSLCQEEFEINISIIGTPQLDSIEDVVVCGFYILPVISGEDFDPDSAFYFDQTGGAGNMWIAGDTLFESGTFYAYAQNSGCFAEVSFEVEIGEGPVINPFSDTLTGCGFAILPDISGSDLTGDEAFYTEQGGEGIAFQPGDTVFSSGTFYAYSLFEENGSVCISEEALEVLILNLPQLSITGTDSVCVGETITLEVSGALEYEWTGPDGFSSDSSQIAIDNASTDNAGIYTVSGIDQNGCSVTDSFLVAVEEFPDFTLLGTACASDFLSWEVIFVSNALLDGIDVSQGSLSQLAADTFTVTDLDLSSGLSIGLAFEGSNCVSQFFVSAPNCDCDDIDPPISGGDQEICQGDDFPQLSAQTSSGLTINWYEEPVGGSPVLENSATFTPPFAGIWYAEAVDTLTNCVSDERTAIALIVNDLPELFFVSSFCAADGASWSVVFNTNADSAVANLGELNFLPNDTILITGIPLNDDIEIEFFISATACSVNSIVLFNLNCDCDDIDPPISGGDVSVCEGQSPEPLLATVDQGFQVNWYDEAVGGSLVLENDTLFLPPGPGTWYAETVDTATACISSTRTPVTFSLLPLPTVEIVVTDCEDDEEFYFVTFTVDITTFWLVSAGDTTANPDGSITTNAIPVAQSPLQIYLFGANGCRDTILVDAPVCDCPELPAPLGGGTIEICDDEDFPLFEAIVDSGLTVNWYDSPEGGELLHQGSLSFMPSQVGNFYAETIDTITGCFSETRTEFELIIIPAPTIELVQIDCDDDEETYFVILQDDSIGLFDWFLIGEGDIEIQADGQIIISQVPLGETIRLRGLNLITGLCQRDFDFDSPNCDCPELAPPVSQGNVEICQGEAIPPLVVEVDSGLTVNWYEEPDSETPLALGTMEYTPAAAGVYYAETVDPVTGCVSEVRTSIELTIHPRPLLPLIDPGCIDNEFYFVIIRTNADSVMANFGTVIVGANDTFTISGIPIDEDLVLLLTFTETGCQREFTIEAPDCDCPTIAPPVSAGDLEFCEGDPIPEMVVSVPPGLIVNWYDAATGGTLLVGNSPNFIPSSAGTYYAEAVDPISGCSSDTRTSVSITELPLPTYEFVSIFCSSEAFYEMVFVSNGSNFILNEGTLQQFATDSFRVTNIPVGMDLIIEIDLGPCNRIEVVNSLNCGCPEIPLPVDSILAQYCDGMSIPWVEVNLPDSLQLDWYDAPEGGSLVEANASEFRAPAPGVYYGEIVIPGTSCVSDSRIVLEVIEWPLPFAELVSVECHTEDGITAVFYTDAVEVLVDTGEVEMFASDSFRVTQIPQGGEVAILLIGPICVNIVPFIEEDCTGCQPIVEFNVTDPPCPEVATGSIEINAIDRLDLPADLSLDGDFVDIISSLPYSLNQLSTGNYQLTIESGECRWDQNIVLSAPASIANLTANPAEYTPGMVIQLNVNTNLNPDLVSWMPSGITDCDDCTSIEYTVTGVQTISVLVQDSLGCAAEASLVIRPLESRAVYLPNVFSPNADGVNDLFRPYFPSDFRGEIKSFEIYNRWGNRVFARYDIPVEPQAQVPGWDGVFNGEEMVPAVYVYQIEIMHSDGFVELFQGEVLLLR
ncbi:MAG: hypothetical protein EA409_07120 [Saprospirales bacterium]|nr:MAG: hypothetical protein EA409_07120 [Saprospirales bacterium]